MDQLERRPAMAKFIFLGSGGKMPESKEEGAKLMKAWEDWFAEMGSSVLDQGNPFSPVAKITAGGSVGDVPAEALVNGYMIIEAESREKAVKIAQECPLLLSESDVAVYEASQGM
jgi:hypothetical protein